MKGGAVSEFAWNSCSRNMLTTNGTEGELMAKIPCKGKTTAGAACRAPAGAGGLCYFHAHPDQTHTLGQIGGRKNRSKVVEPPAAGALSASYLRDILAEAIQDVRSKNMPPRTAGAIAQLCNSAHKILQTADLEARLVRLEQQLAEQQSRTAVDTEPVSTRGQEEACDATGAQPGDVDTPGIGDVAEGKNDASGKDGKA
jgi:hypothetical protein